ncbi:MAG TPA: hypothetical protein VG537_01310 [Candidatus Kapabacteria bacterium]|jgi:hypothetical protein|nr:hypothetical protein [Candidatus Kapabacteria bacterium]
MRIFLQWNMKLKLRWYNVLFIFLILPTLFISRPVSAQHRRKTSSLSVQKKSKQQGPQVKPDILVLRYKPQAGTLLYNIQTEVDQHVRTDRDELSGNLISTAQLAFHTVSIDYKKGLWSFDQYFTKFLLSGRQLNGDSLSLRENEAVDKITRLTYEMKGTQLNKVVIDSIKLLNTEAQANSYFLEPPRLLIPLPERSVTYGDSWKDHSMDTIPVRDTVNMGITLGQFTYSVYRTYKLARLVDTLGSYLAVIVATDSGSFTGWQDNSVTQVNIGIDGPITGADTTYLDLFSGRVMLRTLKMSIPARVKVERMKPPVNNDTVHTGSTSSQSSTPPEAAPLPPSIFIDHEEIRSVTSLDVTNAKTLAPGE